MNLIVLVSLGLFFMINLSDVKSLESDGCVFPVKVGRKKHKSCFKGEEKNPWCSYTKKFKGVWRYCGDLRKSDHKCVDQCQLFRGQKYPSCRSTSRKRIFCTDKIKYLAESDSDPFDPKCPKKYKKPKYHTGCLATSKYAVKLGITETDKKEIVALHDNWRMKVSKPAKKMMKFYYDEDLAYLAQKHAARCSFAHDKAKYRRIFKGKNPGQNIVKVTGSQSANITAMFDRMYRAESIRFQYGKGVKKRFKRRHLNAGHYSQIILDHVSRIGCGYSDCVFAERREQFFVCNFDNMQFRKEMKKPYKLGSWCSGCKNCVMGKLCDCGDKECKNGGKMNPKTCECKCKGFWGGDTCEEEIKSVKQENGCMIPYKWKGKLKYGCIDDPQGWRGLTCSSKKKMTWSTIIKCSGMKKVD